MQAYFVVSVLAVSVPFGDSINSKTTEVPTATQILDAWARRASSLGSGKISWTVHAKNWNIFGRFETDWVPNSTPVGQEITGALSFTAQSARYDSFSFSYADFGYSRTRHETEQDFYRATIYSGFSLRANEYRELLPYTVILSANDRLHFWHGNENEYPRAIILPAVTDSDSPSLESLTKFNSDSNEAFSGGPSTVIHQLLAAPALLTFRPLLYDRSLVQEGTLLDIDELQPTYAGRPCVVLRVRHATKVVPTNETGNSHHKDQKISTKRIYWVDPSRDFAVVRCISMKNDKPFTQIDINYDQVADIGWIPSTWTVLRFHPRFNVVQKMVVAVRTDIDVGHTISDALMTMSFSPQTCVINTLKDQRYIIRDDLSKCVFPKDTVSKYTHEYLMRISKKGTQGHSKNPMGSGKAYRILVGLFNWPGVLIPVALIILILIIINGWLVRRRNPRSASGEPKIDPRIPAEGD